MTSEERQAKFRSLCESEIRRRFQQESKAAPAILFFSDFLNGHSHIKDLVETLSVGLLNMYAEKVVTEYLADLPQGPLRNAGV